MKINSRILLFPKNKINLTYQIIACATILNLILENSFNYLNTNKKLNISKLLIKTYMNLFYKYYIYICISHIYRSIKI